MKYIQTETKMYNFYMYHQFSYNFHLKIQTAEAHSVYHCVGVRI